MESARPSAPGRCAILVVDSNPLLRDYLQHLLRSRFPQAAVTAVDGERDALFHILAGAPDLIFVHVRAGDGHGFELIRTFRRAAPAAKLALLSDGDWPEYREEALRCGADYFLEKGAVHIDDILKVVRAAGGADAGT